MTENAKLKIVGLCFLAAFPLYGGGQALLGGEIREIGLVLSLLNSVAVITIGFLLRPSILPTMSGTIYLSARVIEGLFLAFGVLILYCETTVWGQSNTFFYRTAMIALGLGSLPMCLWLIHAKFTAFWLGALGLFGYFCLASAMVLEISGMGSIAMYFLLPGAVFEIAFGISLLMRRN